MSLDDRFTAFKSEFDALVAQYATGHEMLLAVLEYGSERKLYEYSEWPLFVAKLRQHGDSHT